MKYPSPYVALFAATAVLAVPLNINMGAYSPALVVGDGAIGFKGAESVNQIMNTLQGAAASNAAANGAANAAPAAAPAAGNPSNIAPAGNAPAAESVAALSLPEGMGKSVIAREDLTKRLSAEEFAAIEAEIAAEDAEKRDLSASEFAAIEAEIAAEDAEKRDLSAAEFAAIEAEIAAQDAEKRDLSAEDLAEIQEDIEEEDAVKKRDLAGFNAALNFATGALKTGPEVQLGTGEGGSGVGITQKAGGTPSAPARNATRIIGKL